MEVAETIFDEVGVETPWWKGQSDGAFSIKLAWDLVRTSGTIRPILTNLWHPTIIPSICIFRLEVTTQLHPSRRKAEGKSLPTPHTEFISTMFRCWKLSSPYIKRGHVRLLVPLLILWSAWKLRNEAKFNDVPFTSAAITKQVLAYLWRIYKANGFKTEHWRGDLLVAKRFDFNFSNPPTKSPILCRWVAPPIGLCKLNCDGASKGNPGPFGAGRLVRNDRGRLILAFYEFFGDQTNTYAELYGVVRGLQLAWEKGCHNVWVEVDAMAVLQIIKSEKGDWRLQSQLTRIRMLKRKLNLCFTHVYREANQPADFLANSACTMKDSKIIFLAQVLMCIKISWPKRSKKNTKKKSPNTSWVALKASPSKRTRRRPPTRPDEYEAQKDYTRGKPLSPRGISSTARSAATSALAGERPLADKTSCKLKLLEQKDSLLTKESSMMKTPPKLG
ncbi:UNVERIFIED_CONTAM: hypothetical protein Sradi_1518300 [Sesamum radiatum]|uniref:RNase H type-1 domain-containing protein n=1 Tax=Sesamum radiatum TaxID=300843 RepID=A0AAW2U719_SESRA